VSSGIRIGTAGSRHTRFRAAEFTEVAGIIAQTLLPSFNGAAATKLSQRVAQLTTAICSTRANGGSQSCASVHTGAIARAQPSRHEPARAEPVL
jgi:hypothetical protein